MDLGNDNAVQPSLWIVTDDMLDDVALRHEQENLAIARRLAHDPRLGITRITVIGVGGTHVIEPAPEPELTGSRAVDSDTSPGQRVRNVLRHLPRT